MNPDPKRMGKNMVKAHLERIEFDKQMRVTIAETRQEYDSMEAVENYESIDSYDNALEAFKQRQATLIKEAKFELILLNYVFMSDDGKIDSKEKRELKKYFKALRQKIVKSSFIQLESFDYQRYKSFHDISLYIENNYIDYDVFNKAHHEVSKITSFNPKYVDILTQIKTLK